jgi:hypothetical protein
VSIVLYVLFLQFATPIKVFSLIIGNPLYTILVLAAYLIVGIIWSIIKFKLKMEKVKLKLKGLKEEYTEKYNSGETKESWEDWLSNLRWSAGKELMELETYKKEICAWIAYWPPSLVLVLLRDPIRKIADAVYDLLVNKVYRRILESVLKEYLPAKKIKLIKK